MSWRSGILQAIKLRSRYIYLEKSNMANIARKTLHLVPIVGDGVIGDPTFVDGRLIPVLILDCSQHQLLEDLILAHKDTPPGDVTTVWSRKLFSKKEVFLTFEFHRPVETSATIAFDVSTKGGLVDCIINVRGVYLQPLTSGSKVTEGMGKPKILVEVPPTTTFPGWKEIYLRSVEKYYRKRGLPKAQALSAAKDHIARIRNIQFRKKPNEIAQET